MANINLKKVFESSVTLCELMEGREKIETEDIIKNYPEGITIEAIDLIEVPSQNPEKKGELEGVYVYTFKENNKVFAFAGYVLKKCFDNAMSAGFSMDEVTGIKVKLSSGKTKNTKRQITNVEIVG